ncbi:hypothetical protein GE21DRAFT_2227 [Neurospora crassa]|uniref:Uncharacterized protein n=1 Tax=Neurospora crassa (strain ATCC 24698 / 74-OR23-1A / CBS 708.71 / DSM 1257 / FGSC 987) TaxID=367110 RepID=Q7SE63_NEUCR|nr:hypothetical protein NCU00510 [Neurospora crassa OR74A]EAA35078.1 hypothetical protein NCU00510 [Neurospora crassa OR74A]KHE85086.1 hypothetical protein GE21DRAFT_2227 [Neurospora crassa]|eukprot:XP_964314.1 hypothetical protein NCU00510 [Neurospora crassa OR74A]
MPINVVRLSPLFPMFTARRADHPQNAIKAEVGPAIKVAGQQIRAGDAGSTGHAVGTLHHLVYLYLVPKTIHLTWKVAKTNSSQADRGPLSCGDTMPMVTRNRALSDQGLMLAHDSLSLIGSHQ